MLSAYKCEKNKKKKTLKTIDIYNIKHQQGEFYISIILSLLLWHGSFKWLWHYLSVPIVSITSVLFHINTFMQIKCKIKGNMHLYSSFKFNNSNSTKTCLETTRLCPKKSRTADCTTEAPNLSTTIPFKIIIICEFISNRYILLRKYSDPYFPQNCPLPCLTVWLAAIISKNQPVPRKRKKEKNKLKIN